MPDLKATRSDICVPFDKHAKRHVLQAAWLHGYRNRPVRCSFSCGSARAPQRAQMCPAFSVSSAVRRVSGEEGEEVSGDCAEEWYDACGGQSG